MTPWLSSRQARLFETAVELETADARRDHSTDGWDDAPPLLHVEVHVHDSDHGVAVGLREGGRLDALVMEAMLHTPASIMASMSGVTGGTTRSVG